MGESRRTKRSIELVALCAGLLLSTAACTAANPPSPSATASAAESDDTAEAAVLAEAIDAYTRYSAAFDVVLARGDGDYSALEGLTAPEYLKGLMEAEDEFSRGEWKTIGSTSFDSEEVVASTESSVEVRLCLDTSRVRIVTADQVEVSIPERTTRFPVQVSFEHHDGVLVVSGSERVAEESSCD